MNSKKLPDSGERTEFSTGAVRDAARGKGRFDLIPLAGMMSLARRFEDGASKYSERNWEKGIPLKRYVDSMIRHAFQLSAGDTSEDHAGAVAWNAICFIQTLEWVKEQRLSVADLDPECHFRGLHGWCPDGDGYIRWTDAMRKLARDVFLNRPKDLEEKLNQTPAGKALWGVFNEQESEPLDAYMDTLEDLEMPGGE